MNQSNIEILERTNRWHLMKHLSQINRFSSEGRLENSHESILLNDSTMIWIDSSAGHERIEKEPNRLSSSSLALRNCENALYSESEKQPRPTFNEVKLCNDTRLKS